jgi:hypothetical protein
METRLAKAVDTAESDTAMERIATALEKIAEALAGGAVANVVPSNEEAPVLRPLTAAEYEQLLAASLHSWEGLRCPRCAARLAKQDGVWWGKHPVCAHCVGRSPVATVIHNMVWEWIPRTGSSWGVETKTRRDILFKPGSDEWRQITQELARQCPDGDFSDCKAAYQAEFDSVS